MSLIQSKQRSRLQLDDLKRRVGKAPFEARGLRAGEKQPCPFHGGDMGFGVYEKDGIWLATCQSDCKKTWDAISIVMEIDKCDFKTAVAKLDGRSAAPPSERPKPKAMTHAEWLHWGRPVTAEDIATFAASRKDTTASADTFNGLGCRVKDGRIGFPYRLEVEGELKYFLIKTRALNSK